MTYSQSTPVHLHQIRQEVARSSDYRTLHHPYPSMETPSYKNSYVAYSENPNYRQYAAPCTRHQKKTSTLSPSAHHYRSTDPTHKGPLQDPAPATARHHWPAHRTSDAHAHYLDMSAPHRDQSTRVLSPSSESHRDQRASCCVALLYTPSTDAHH